MLGVFYVKKARLIWIRFTKASLVLKKIRLKVESYVVVEFDES